MYPQTLSAPVPVRFTSPLFCTKSAAVPLAVEGLVMFSVLPFRLKVIYLLFTRTSPVWFISASSLMVAVPPEATAPIASVTLLY